MHEYWEQVRRDARALRWLGISIEDITITKAEFDAFFGKTIPDVAKQP